MTQQPERPVSAKEMAARLGVCAETVRRMARSGAIPAILLHAQRRFVPSQVFEALERRSASPAS
jgi:excisionase family DNA binding protein